VLTGRDQAGQEPEAAVPWCASARPPTCPASLHPGAGSLQLLSTLSIRRHSVTCDAFTLMQVDLTDDSPPRSSRTGGAGPGPAAAAHQARAHPHHHHRNPAGVHAAAAVPPQARAHPHHHRAPGGAGLGAVAAAQQPRAIAGEHGLHQVPARHARHAVASPHRAQRRNSADAMVVGQVPPVRFAAAAAPAPPRAAAPPAPLPVAVAPPAPAPPAPPPPESPEDKTPQCPLCLDGMTEGLCSVPCGHVFHYSCMREAFKGGFKKCPKCRKTIRTDKQINRIYFS
jgi:Ring finger domain